MAIYDVSVIGAGLAGCEAAWILAQGGVKVRLCEMKPHKYSPAHSHPGMAELVCSNSLKAEREGSAQGLLKAEMRILGSLILQCAEDTRVPAGGALAVDRQKFSDAVTARIKNHPNIEVVSGEVTEIPGGYTVIATGPLTSDALAHRIGDICGGALSFYDAAAPIITAESVDMQIAYFQSRYDRGGAEDYLNCPFGKDEYERFHAALAAAQTAPQKDFDVRVYEGCMPVEIMAGRGVDTLRYGPLRPVGLRDPRTGKRPWAVVQLRRENAAGTLLNLVGFQTNLKFPEQKRVFAMIPGLENIDIVRYGVMHRNTFIDSPRLLDRYFRLKTDPRIRFAGQITGVEGYMESAMSGLAAAHNLLREIRGDAPLELPPQTMSGALCGYISDESIRDFQPMGANMGILAPLAEHIRNKQARYEALARRSLNSLQRTVDNRGVII